MGGICLASDEPGFDPDRLSTPSQIDRQTPTVVHCAGTNDQDGFTDERRFLSFHFVHAGGDQDRGEYVADVPAPFTGLNADEVDVDVENFGGALRMADHVMSRIQD